MDNAPQHQSASIGPDLPNTQQTMSFSSLIDFNPQSEPSSGTDPSSSQEEPSTAVPNSVCLSTTLRALVIWALTPGSVLKPFAYGYGSRCIKSAPTKRTSPSPPSKSPPATRRKTGQQQAMPPTHHVGVHPQRILLRPTSPSPPVPHHHPLRPTRRPSPSSSLPPCSSPRPIRPATSTRRIHTRTAHPHPHHPGRAPTRRPRARSRRTHH